MSAYNVAQSMRTGRSSIDKDTGVPLAAGAILGGIAGNYLFANLKKGIGLDSIVGAVQSAVLLLLTVGTIVYTLKKIVSIQKI